MGDERARYGNCKIQKGNSSCVIYSQKIQPVPRSNALFKNNDLKIETEISDND